MASVTDAVLERFFSPENRASIWGQSVRAVLLGTDPRGYAGCCVALRDINYTDAAAGIRTPTLVIGSDQDPSTPWETNGKVLAHAIPGAKRVVLRGAHLSNLEGPRSFTAALLDFLLRSDGGGSSSQT
jgi:3-oxoadipate enol-lactonase